MRKPNPTKLAAALVIALGSASVFANTGKTTSTDTSTNLSNNAATAPR